MKKDDMMRMAGLAFAIALLAAAPATAASCEERVYRNADYVVCRSDPQADDIRLFLNDKDDAPWRHFNFLQEALAANGERLVFAINAGMYHDDRSPVGLYREAGETLAPINTNDGPGNFHLKPNGVFYVAPDGRAFVEETDVYLRIKQPAPRYATQSGPMLVIGGDIHPRFLPDSDSLKRRNGVGVTEAGEAIFVLADSPVRFYDFATFFRDELNTPNALYLDGVISRLYAPELGRNDPGLAMGPIVGVVTAYD